MKTSRSTAIRTGALTYKGRPCPHGHDGTRYTRNMQCRQCQIALNATNRKNRAAAKRLALAPIKEAKRLISAQRATDHVSLAAMRRDVHTMRYLMYVQSCCCAYCGEWDTQLHLDYITPTSLGGAYGKANVQLLCKTHRIGKRDSGMGDEAYRRHINIPACTPWDAL